MNRNVPLLILIPLLVFAACQGNETDQAFDDPKEYVRIGNQYLRKRSPQFRAAIKQYRLALNIEPNHFDALIGLGDASAFRAKALESALNSEEEQAEVGAGSEQGSGSGERTNVPEGLDRRPSSDMSVEERISRLIKQAAIAYARAKIVRPESALPYFKYGRLIYQFRERSPESIGKSIRLLSSANERLSKEKSPRLQAKIHYFLGAAKLYREELKSEEKRDYSDVRSHFETYLDIFDSRGVRAPRRAQIERVLMDIESEEQPTNESSSDS